MITISENEHINYCGVRAFIEILGGKWKFQIISLLYGKPRRYSQILEEIPQASEKMILTSLRELEEHKILERFFYTDVPPRTEYRITQYGKSLKALLRSIEKWGSEHIKMYPETVYFDIKDRRGAGNGV